VILAHQGGWDEALMVLAPIGLLFVLLWIANRRAKQQLDADPADTNLANDDPTDD
jgi:cyanate permease